jgi:hypothetical protein
MRAALAVPPLDDLLGPGGFAEEEADTAVDREPLATLALLPTDLEQTATQLPTDDNTTHPRLALPPPADGDTATMMIPPEVATALRHASVRTEPPPSPLSDDEKR